MLSIGQKTFENESSLYEIFEQDTEATIHSAHAINGKKILTIFQGCQLPKIFIENGKAFKQVKHYDLPLVFKEVSTSILQAMLKTAKFKVSCLSNGDYKVDLCFGLKGGMISLTELKKQVRQLEYHAGLVNSLERNLEFVSIERFLKPEEILIQGGFVGGGLIVDMIPGIGVGIGVGSILGAAAGFLSGGIIGVVGAVIGALVGWFVSRKYLDKHKKNAEAIKECLTKVQEYFYILKIKMLDGKKEEVKTIAEDLINHLKNHQYLNSFTDSECEFNEFKFSEIKDYIQDEKDRINVLFAIKLIILSSFIAIPQEDRPTDSIRRLLLELLQTAGDGADFELKNFAYTVVAQLYIEKKNNSKGKEFFQKVSQKSGWYEYAVEMIKYLDYNDKNNYNNDDDNNNQKQL